VRATDIGTSVDQRLAAMKEELGLGGPTVSGRIEAAPDDGTTSKS
jgi:hypothetical protein